MGRVRLEVATRVHAGSSSAEHACVDSSTLPITVICLCKRDKSLRVTLDPNQTSDPLIQRDAYMYGPSQCLTCRKVWDQQS
eukprot:COSAG03_NODE_979_length_5128_cov_7.000398_1_plen_81_part_00